MSLYCIESLGTRYKDLSKDNEFDFYKNYLLSYEEYLDSYRQNLSVEGSTYVRCDDDTQNAFGELKNLYGTSKSNTQDELSELEMHADSFMFFVGCGLIKMTQDGYYIDLEKLQEISSKYHELEEVKTLAFSKGTLK